MGLKDAYLVLYNSACCAGWAYVWYAACTTILDKVANQSPFGDASAQVYAHDDTATMLTYAQSAALLEILHAALGLVRSPVMVTAMQVMSRIVALVALVFSSQAQSKWPIA
jgi:very-long-chain (3R)-3-hydroxyacyl-CoA dehydratase